jgi:hypothetical protein
MRLLIVLGGSQNYQNVAVSNQLMDDGRGREQCLFCVDGDNESVDA